MATAIEGIEVLVFTGGIGENSPKIRRNVCARLGWIGLRLDDEANAAGQEQISLGESECEVLVIPTDEEITIARHTLNLVRRNAVDAPYLSR
jgi:acetate kinase